MGMAGTAEKWTADDLDRLPDDGNKYKIVNERLLVTPAPSLRHEVVLNALADRLRAYVRANGVGQVFTRNDLRFDGRNRVDPDLSVVRVPLPPGDMTWHSAPRPVLVVEVLSPSTRAHDLGWKARLYSRETIPAVWIVDHEERVIRVIGEGAAMPTVAAMLSWHPVGAAEPFTLDVAEFFASALGPR
jgi:Uma2 family endonuclease